MTMYGVRRRLSPSLIQGQSLFQWRHIHGSIPRICSYSLSFFILFYLSSCYCICIFYIILHNFTLLCISSTLYYLNPYSYG